MARVRPSLASRDEAVPWLIGSFGIVALLAFFVETAVFSGLDPDVVLSARIFVSSLLVAAPVGGLVYGGYWLRTSPVEPERYARVGWWCLSGALALFTVNFLLQLVLWSGRLWLSVGLLRGSLTLGGATGLLIGTVEARAVQRAVDAERSSVRAGYLEAQRDWLDYLNGLLRHEVLNTAQVVGGYVDVILERKDLDRETRQQLRAIRRQTEDMSGVIQDVRLLIDATHDEAELEPVDLESVVREELQDVRDTYEAVAIDVEMDVDVAVWGDALLPRVFSNLLSNAVEHNDGDRALVRVEAAVSDGTALVRVADDGPGVPEDERATLFERGTATDNDPGVGLHVVSLLVERYGGSVSLTETGPEGSVFTVELPRATGDVTADAGSQAAPSGPIPGVGGTGSAAGNGPAAASEESFSSDEAPNDRRNPAEPQPDGGSEN